MPSQSADLSLTIQGTGQVFGGLDIHIQPLGAELDVAVADTETQTVGADTAVALSGITAQSSLDMWVADGGALSQLFALDTSVSTPLIVGDHTVAEPGANVTYEIANLDADVVSIALGPSTQGVLGFGGFVNNGDGTGRFVVTFNPAFPSRVLSIIATDDVANESAESPAFNVYSVENYRYGDTLSIAPQASVSTATCNSLIDAIPETEFILKRRYTVPFSFNDTIFEVQTITPLDPIDIVVIRRDASDQTNETQRYVVIPDQQTMAVAVKLGRGINVITAADPQGNVDTIIVAATTYAAVMCTYAREIYNYSQVLIEEQDTAIYSPVSTRLAESLLPFADLLPDVKSQQVLATKLAVRSLIHDAGRDQGVRDLLTALTLSTPMLVPNTASSTDFEPAVVPLFRNQEAFAGVDAHVWPANQCVQRWLGFVRYLQALPVFQIVEVTENEVLFVDDTGVPRRHVFDFSAEECSLTTLALQSICFDNIDVSMVIFSRTAITLCAATYPLDLRPTPLAPVLPLFDEFAVELALDPGFDGYVGFSVSRHWDGGTVLDSMGPAATDGSGLTPCAYPNGYLVRPLLLGSASPTATVTPTVSVVTSIQNAKAAALDISVDLAGQQLTQSIDAYIGLPECTADCDMLVTAEQNVVGDLDVLISL